MSTELSSRQTPAPPVARNAWTRPGFLGAAGVVALLVLGAGFVALAPGHDNSATPAPGAPAAAPAAGRTASDSVCGLPAGAQKVPARTPAAEWELVGNLAAPSSRGVGPGKVIGGQRSCYAHSPTGALYAAANAQAVLNGPATTRWGFENLLAAGQGRDKAVAAVRAQKEFPPGTGQMQGFQFLPDSDANSAVIDLALRQSIPGTPDVLYRKIVTLRWEGGDWKLVADPAGYPYYGKQAVADLTGYILWSGI